jgi:hypothetical protein
VGAVLQLLPLADEIHECRTAKTNTKTTRSKKKATTSYLENTPRRATVNPQRLVQHPVERGAVITELLPQLLLLLGVGEVGGGASTRSSPEEGGPARDEEASAPCLRPPATMWPSHLLARAPSRGSGAGVGRLAHWSHPGGGTSS